MLCFYSLSLINKRFVFTWSKQSNFVLYVPNLEVETGNNVFLHGRSRIEKSTLLNLISGVENRYTGHLQVL
jgi:putative ABC transport system ATP-binding protein